MISVVWVAFWILLITSLTRGIPDRCLCSTIPSTKLVIILLERIDYHWKTFLYFTALRLYGWFNGLIFKSRFTQIVWGTSIVCDIETRYDIAIKSLIGHSNGTLWFEIVVVLFSVVCVGASNFSNCFYYRLKQERIHRGKFPYFPWLKFNYSVTAK